MSRIVILTMPKLIPLLVFGVFLFLSPSFAQKEPKDVPFNYGEILDFEVSYGWLNLADAKLKINRKPRQVNGEDHFKIDVFGKTKGAAAIFGKVNDNWGSLLNVNTLLPSQSYRHIEEGNYRKHEVVDFDQKNQKAYSTLYDRDNKNVKEKRFYDLPGEVQDIVSGFYFLRSQNIEEMNKGDVIVISGFFDKESYNIQLIYEGEEEIKTMFGPKMTYMFSPKIPQNKLFRGDFPVKVWVTQDENKIPVKIKANIFIGSLNLDLVSAKGLKHPY